MPRIRRILVAVKDTAARKLPAVDKAAQLARALNAELELFHAIAEPVYVDALSLAGESVSQLQRKWRAAHLKKLERVADKLRATGTKVTTRVDWDFPAFEAVVRRANRAKADLIVAERHGGKHVAPWLLRFNDWELLRRSPLPVLLVKSAKPWDKPTVLAAIDPSHSFAKPAKLDNAVLDAGRQVAQALRGELHVAHAFAPATLDIERLDLNLPDLSAHIEKQAERLAQDSLDKALAGSDIPKARRHLIGRHAVDAIPASAQQLHAGLVVMGAISRSGIQRLLIGNTAERILDALACDVLVIKPTRFKRRVPAGKRGVQFIATPLVV